MLTGIRPICWMEIAGESTFIHEETPSKRKGTSHSVGESP